MRIKDVTLFSKIATIQQQVYPRPFSAPDKAACENHLGQICMRTEHMLGVLDEATVTEKSGGTIPREPLKVIALDAIPRTAC
ncbi:uncharacterized protein ARMOST_02167 [Armillaria ostoyae]|uniref:Uncharacterized protein n=1 Tax=Armillaria ostoyae TaxID=47428 RepID=A0A284QQY8_ARMOS|nr:uncharacterized protein ARMOST_02167 [Armillaria ostoyae]